MDTFVTDGRAKIDAAEVLIEYDNILAGVPAFGSNKTRGRLTAVEVTIAYTHAIIDIRIPKCSGRRADRITIVRGQVCLTSFLKSLDKFGTPLLHDCASSYIHARRITESER